ncbi:MAG: hypothetical protein JNK68_12935 [Betaproteobacteria bacterium]|nr:hypothetical protein [Betaproteobacteria bacterium]
MAILRCSKCGHLEELPPEAAGTTQTCPHCQASVQAHDTVYFVSKALEKLFALQVEAVRLRAVGAGGSMLARSAPLAGSAEPFDLHNSALLSTELQHGPVRDWFQRRQVRVRTNPRAVDTTGFFDEVAVAIGRNYSVLKEVVDRIRFAQMKGFTQATIHFERKTPEQVEHITRFCRQLFEYSFIAKCLHLKDEKPRLRLILQTAPAIREFFNGDWLEWLVLMTLLESAREHGLRYSCARNLVITLQNEETFELDVFFLIDGTRPLCVECKSGDFRQDIDRCLTLRRRLGIGRDDFIVCAAGLDAKQAAGFSSTYDLVFCSERDLRAQLERSLVPAVDTPRSARTA